MIIDHASLPESLARHALKIGRDHDSPHCGMIIIRAGATAPNSLELIMYRHSDRTRAGPGPEAGPRVCPAGSEPRRDSES